MKELLLNICITAIALYLFKMLVPDGFGSKQVNFLISCFFLASMAFFITAGRASFAEEIGAVGFSFNVNEYYDYSAAYEREHQQALGIEIRNRLLPILSKEGIFPEEILTIVNISDNGSISINEIRLVFDSGVTDGVTDASASAPVGTEVGGGGTEVSEPPELVKRAVEIVQREVGNKIAVSAEVV